MDLDGIALRFVFEDKITLPKSLKVNFCWISDIVIGVAALDLIQFYEGSLQLFQDLTILRLLILVS